MLIYNPVDAKAIARAGEMPVEHSWLTDRSRPLVLGVGRLHRQKDFPRLSLPLPSHGRNAIFDWQILREGSERKKLEMLCHLLGVQNAVFMPGFIDNPCAWMSRASLFALSSAWESFALVLVEAGGKRMFPISIGGPNGLREILRDGI